MGLFFLCRSTFAHDGGASVSKAAQSYPTTIFGLLAATQTTHEQGPATWDCEGGMGRKYVRTHKPPPPI